MKKTTRNLVPVGRRDSSEKLGTNKAKENGDTLPRSTRGVSTHVPEQKGNPSRGQGKALAVTERHYSGPHAEETNSDLGFGIIGGEEADQCIEGELGETERRERREGVGRTLGKKWGERGRGYRLGREEEERQGAAAGEERRRSAGKGGRGRK